MLLAANSWWSQEVWGIQEAGSCSGSRKDSRGRGRKWQVTSWEGTAGFPWLGEVSHHQLVCHALMKSCPNRDMKMSNSVSENTGSCERTSLSRSVAGPPQEVTWNKQPAAALLCTRSVQVCSVGLCELPGFSFLTARLDQAQWLEPKYRLDLRRSFFKILKQILSF